MATMLLANPSQHAGIQPETHTVLITLSPHMGRFVEQLKWKNSSQVAPCDSINAAKPTSTRTRSKLRLSSFSRPQ